MIKHTQVSENSLKETFHLEACRLNRALEDCSLNKEQVIEEVFKIQSTLLAGEAVGYIYTNGHQSEFDHFEVLIITENKIIKPVDWPGRSQFSSINSVDFPSLYFTEIKEITEEGKNYIPQVQAGPFGCTTLGLMYLKELLKQNGNQLIQYTLSFSFYDKKGIKHNFFFPSPQTLRYSQSSAYNKVILAMLQCEKEHFIHHKENTIAVYTLRGILEESIIIAEKNGDQECMEENKQILANLPRFVAQWEEKIEEILAKRDAMTKNERNYYLAYSTSRMRKISPQKILELEITEEIDNSFIDYDQKEKIILNQQNILSQESFFQTNDNLVLKKKYNYNPGDLLNEKIDPVSDLSLKN